MTFIWIANGVRLNIPVVDSELKTNKIIASAKVKAVDSDLPEQTGQQSFINHLAQQSYEGGQPPPHERQQIVQAHEIMSTPVITVPPSTTITKAWLLIQDHRFQYIPIVNSAGAPLGMLCDRNLLRSAFTLGWDLNHMDNPDDPDQTVGTHFSAPVLTALPHAEIRQIAKTLFEEHLGAIPIIDSDNSVLGIVTRSDIIKALVYLGIEIWG